MFHKLKSWFTPYVYPLILLFIIGVLCGANYTANTYLSGWDTLHPEFNVPLAIERIFGSVWRSDQGLGAVAIQSHMADLPHVLYLLIASIVLPQSTLRYSFFFLMLLAGPLGMYALASHITKFTHREKLVGFLAGLTYLCNLGTVQHFVVPLEMFAVHYGLVPWLLLCVFQILENPSRKKLIVLAAVSFGASAQGQTATLLYAYIAGLVLFLVPYVLLHMSRWRVLFRRACMIVIITFAMNAYVILPNVYAVVTHGSDVRNSKVNQLFSPEAFAKNQEFGTIQNASLLKNFLFDWELYNFNSKPQQFEPVLNEWINHLKTPLVSFIGYGVFALSLVGIVTAVAKRRRMLIVLILGYAVSFTMLLTGMWPMTIVFEKLGTVLPVAREALRFPFTKFSILFMVPLSIYAAYGVLSIMVLLKKLHITQRVIAISYVVCILVYFLPAFTGNLINPAMRITIPSRYNDLFSWFDKQDHAGRVAILPIHSFWNWVYYDWGYQGAGFLQFGIPQPILDRDYDRWSPYNEQYQREMVYAVYSQQPDVLRSVLTKYNIRYILFDESVQNTNGRDEATFKWAIPGLLSQTQVTHEVATFGGTLHVYDVTTSHSPVVTYTDIPGIGPRMSGGPEDTAYDTIQAYVTYSNTNDIVQPYRGAFTNDERFVANDIPMTPVVSFFPSTSTLVPLQRCSTSAIQESRDLVGGTLRYTSTGGPLCDHISFPTLTHDNGYIMEITSRNISGFPLQICISNPLSRLCNIFVHLGKNAKLTTERFLLPPLADGSQGYSVDVNNFAIHGQTSTNELSNVQVFQIDYPVITGKNSLPTTGARATDATTRTYGTWLTVANVQTEDASMVAFDQAYDNGWLAWFDGKFLPHVLVNNWSNGWTLDQSAINNQQSTIFIFFWPQILEWIGFALLPIPFLILLVRKNTYHPYYD